LEQIELKKKNAIQTAASKWFVALAEKNVKTEPAPEESS
jgi:hypothetical protein